MNNYTELPKYIQVAQPHSIGDDSECLIFLSLGFGTGILFGFLLERILHDKSKRVFK